MIKKQTIYKVKCLCGKTIHGKSLESLESGWQKFQYNRCTCSDFSKLIPFEKKFYDELHMKKGKHE